LIEQFSNDFAQRVANPTIEHNNELNDESHAGLEEEVMDFTVEEVQVLHEQAQDAATKERSKQLLAIRKQNGICVGVHNGIITPLLPSWRYPQKMNLQQMISLWLLGIRSENVPPLRFLSARHVPRGITI
jgi:hypothetical protein